MIPVRLSITKPTGLDEKFPPAKPVIVGDGFIPEVQ